MPERDPRINPRPGDVVRIGQLERRVESVETHGGLQWVRFSVGGRPWSQYSLMSWRTVCAKRKAEVIQRAEGVRG